MKKVTIIRPVPRWCVRFRILPENFSISLHPYIFLAEKLYKDLERDSLSVYTSSMIAHESTHIQMQSALGLWKWLFFYICSKRFCWEEELFATEAEMRIYKSMNIPFNVKIRAQTLSTFWLYHSCISFGKAEEVLKRLWTNVIKSNN